MNVVYFLNSNYRYIKECKKKLNDFECIVFNEQDINKIMENNNISKDSRLYNDYLRLKVIYDNGGLILDGNFEIINSLDNFINNDIFCGFKTENKIATNIMWAKNSNNKFIFKLLKEIENNQDKSITEIFSSVLNIDLSKKINTTVKIYNNSYIYSYDYFYPLDYEFCGKDFSENTRAIYYKDKHISIKQKLKLKFFKNIGSSSYMYMKTLIDTTRKNLASKKYKFQQMLGKKDISYENQLIALNKAIKTIQGFEDIDYIIIHNPRWMGVTSATKELFENLVSLQELSRKKDINKLAKVIIQSEVKQVIFSAFAYGWEDLARILKRLNPNIKLKVFWHGSHSQVIEEINWNTNVQVIKLHKEGIIDVFATCKESLYNFYVAQGYTTSLILNTVNLNNETKDRISQNVKYEKNNIKIGIYAAGLDWRKNMYAQIAAASLIKNAEVDLVPFNFEGKVFAGRNNLKISGSEKGLPRDELLVRMSQNNINLYVTFSECAPMLPIESMEVKTICIIGNNNHYFQNTELEKYLVIDREDDVCSIKDKIIFALENKDKIFELYTKWKNNYDVKSKKSVMDFLSK